MDRLFSDPIVKPNAVDPASLLGAEEENDVPKTERFCTSKSDFHRGGGFSRDISNALFVARKYRNYLISLVVVCLAIISMWWCVFRSPALISRSAAVTSMANGVTLHPPPAAATCTIGDLNDSKRKPLLGSASKTKSAAAAAAEWPHHIDDAQKQQPPRAGNQNSKDHHSPAAEVQLRPYKDTGIRLPVLPSYGPPETARLGFDHVYVIHNLGHPDRLVRMARVLQLLRITAEFVPVIEPPQAQPPAESPLLPTASNNMPSLQKNIIGWHTHHRIYRDMAEQGYRSALILDDSVDMELNIKTIMRAIHRHMPADWDMLFPGHCGAFEGIQPRPNPDSLPSLRLANMPICLHAHAVSRKGLLRLLHYLPQLPASNEAIGMAIMRLKEEGRLKMYSVDTPVFTPRPAEQDTGRGKPRLAGNKKLDISAIDHLALWQGQNH
ncbi:hypothetical protein GGH99_000563 [Coemansia sp. RSA 1285]|nr:hypothetical protein GGH99_000563 [Coemansia sp. RSA 1285]